MGALGWGWETEALLPNPRLHPRTSVLLSSSSILTLGVSSHPGPGDSWSQGCDIGATCECKRRV